MPPYHNPTSVNNSIHVHRKLPEEVIIFRRVCLHVHVRCKAYTHVRIHFMSECRWAFDQSDGARPLKQFALFSECNSEEAVQINHCTVQERRNSVRRTESFSLMLLDFLETAKRGPPCRGLETWPSIPHHVRGPHAHVRGDAVDLGIAQIHSRLQCFVSSRNRKCYNFTGFE